MFVFVQLRNKALKGVVRKSTLLAFIQQFAQSFEFSFNVFKSAQASPYNFTSRAISPAFYLFGNKIIKMLTKCNTCIFSHILPQKYQYIPNFGIKAITSQLRSPTKSRALTPQTTRRHLFQRYVKIL